MNKTFYSAYTCKNNLGDLIINKMQIEEYSKYGEVYVDFTGMPDNFKNILLNQNNPNIKDLLPHMDSRIEENILYKLSNC